MDADAGAARARAIERDGIMIAHELTGKFEEFVVSLRRLVIPGLPSISLDTYESAATHGPACSAVYFLWSKREGLLYIGKATNVRNRWRLRTRYDRSAGREAIWWEMCHSRLRDAVELGDVRLHWWDMPRQYITAVESLLLQIHRPTWNACLG